MGRPVQVEPLLSGIRDTSGNALSSGKVYFYDPGTTTRKLVWTDSAKATAASQPVTLDAAGRALVYADGLYRIVITDSDDTSVYDWDNLRFLIGDSTMVFAGTLSGSGTYTGTLAPALTEYEAGLRVYAKIGSTNTTSPPTLNLNGLGAKNIVVGGSTEAVRKRQLTENQMVTLVYDGTSFQLLNCDGSDFLVYTSFSYGGSGSMSFAEDSDNSYEYYRVRGTTAQFIGRLEGTTSGTGSDVIYVDTTGILTPTVAASATYGAACGSASISEASATPVSGFVVVDETTNRLHIRKYDGSNFAIGAVSITYNILTRIDS